jgi:hypothetical protein
VKEENRNIQLFLGDVSLNENLGVYYIDLRPSIINYTNNIYNGGLDELGVPFMCGENKEIYYTAVNIAQYGLILHAEYRENKKNDVLEVMLNCAKKIEEISSHFNSECTVWYYYSKSSRYSMKYPWTSAMAQGQVISFLLRIHQITGEKHFLEIATKAYNYLSIDFSEGGVKRIDKGGYAWLEEYPSDPPSYVLNGFIYALFGMYDLYRVTKNSRIKNEINHYLLTLKNNIHRYDSGYWSYYDLLNFELVRYYYQNNVHVLQLEALYILSQEEIFIRYAKKWKKNLNIINFLFVQIMYRIQPRWRKKSLILK